MQPIQTTFQKRTNYQLLNMGADFKQFVTSHKECSVDERWQGWKDLESKYADVFKAGIGDPENQRYEAYKKSQLERLFAILPNFEKTMWDLFDQAEAIADDQIARFKSVFPDMQENVSVIFMPSLGFFNGQGGDNTLYVGVDMVAERADDINILFSHEFFHVYHFEKLKNRKVWQTMASPLWTEGMATWISMNLNPGATLEAAFMDKDLASYSEKIENIVNMAKEYHPIMSSSFNDENGQKATAEWFMTSKRIPNRQGYGLGTYIVSEISKVVPATEMVALDEDGFGTLIDEALKKTLAQ